MRSESPPYLVFNVQDQSVAIGWRRIDDLPEGLLALLRYLYEHRRICTRDELFNRAYFPARYPNAPLEDRREYPVEYNSTLDTAISRLRRKIEPDPKSPVYIITKPGKGYKLEHAW